MGNSSGLLIAVGIVLAVAAAGIVWFLGYRSDQKLRVVVARQNVPSLTDLVATDVEMRSVPIQAVPRGALRSPAAALGRFVRYGLLLRQVVQAANAATAAGASQFDEQLTPAAKYRPDVRATSWRASVARPAGARTWVFGLLDPRGQTPIVLDRAKTVRVRCRGCRAGGVFVEQRHPVLD